MQAVEIQLQNQINSLPEQRSSSSSSPVIVHPVVREDQEKVEIRATNDSNLASTNFENVDRLNIQNDATYDVDNNTAADQRPKGMKPVTSTPHQSPDFRKRIRT